MKMIMIKPVPGRTVRDPETLAILAEGGELKERSAFWLKRIKDDDVIVDKPAKSTKGDKK